MVKPPFDDDKLVDGIKNKDKDAFIRLFDLYYLRLHSFAKAIVLSSSLADDIVQDVFLKLWDCSFELNISGSLRAYLYTMVKNRALNSLRNLHINYDNELERLNALPLDDYQECSVEINSFYAELNKILEFLPQQSRIIFKRRIFEGYKFKEIAKELGISEANCKMIMQRSIAKIKKTYPNIRGLWIFSFVFA